MILNYLFMRKNSILTIDFQLNALIQIIIKTSKFNLCDKKTIFPGCDNDFLLLELVVVVGITKKNEK